MVKEEEIEGILDEKFAALDSKECLNMMVTSYFLEIQWIYTRIFLDLLLPDFSNVIN